MIDNKDKYSEEIKYLDEIISLLKFKLEYETSNLEDQKADLIESRREMWENTTHSSSDFDKLSDLNQYLSALNAQTFTYTELAKRISKYEKMLESPYFARIDFTEDGYDDTEKIYIGLFNLMDEETHDIKVYDWRAPISSIYYRNEVGPVEYKAPAGLIKGIVSLKRQFKITNSKMEYFFDSNINILDEMLMVALSKNMTSKMKTIVETIQKQQDLIIRDLYNDLLVVQGVAGSGKSSVALHRIAYLMYQGLNLNISANNIIVISPNQLFSKYISNVLPELGEDNINEYTFENIFLKLFENKISMKTKSENFENIIIAENEEKRNFLRSYDEFKGSSVFLQIIDRFINYYEHKLIRFEDVYYNGQIIEKRELLKAFLISGKLNMPTAKKLKIIENRIMEKIREMRNIRRSKIETAVNNLNNHEFEIMSFTRVLAAKETQSIAEKLRQFTEFESFDMYKKLFSDINIFKKISKGLDLPENIDAIISYTKDKLKDPFNIPYADGVGLMYMKIKAEGCDLFSGIKQVVVDEAQDYYPIHYYILKNLFKYARFTIVGDVNQSIEKHSDISLYDDIISIFNFEKSNKIKLKLIDYLDYESVLEGTLILPVYLAKGLEFDAVIVYEANDKKYNTKYDKKLLYIACTRALHRLSLFYTGKITRFLK